MRNKSTKALAVVLCVAMLCSLLPTVAFATEWSDNNVVFSGTSFGTNGYYTVISQKEYTLVPGAATETEMVINNAGGTRRQVLHVVEVDPSNPDISIIPGYYGIDKDITDVNNQSAAGVTDMAAYYENVLGYNIVAGMNTALAYDNNAPFSWLVYNGTVLVDRKNNINNFHSGYCQTMLCVYKNNDGSCYCELRTASQGLRGDEWQAVGANFGMVINDGVLVSKTVERSSAAARSMIGIKEDGTLVLVMNDGRGANNSIGFSDYEEGEAMLALGCKWAFNCDGGGSSSFISKRAGETAFAMRCVPCDGAERPTINAVFIASNVGPTGELNNVNVTSDYDIFAPGTTYTFGADAIDTHGYAMDMPADATWTLSDDSFGAIENGTFVSNGTVGAVDIRVVSGGNVVGAKTVTVANPETLAFAATETTLPYGKSTTLEFVSKTGEAQVYLDGSSFSFELSNPAAGTLDGLVFTATTDENAAGTTITATYVPTGAELTFTVNLGKGSEVLWDFEDGDISAWVSTEEADQFMRDGGAPVQTSGNFSSPFRTMWNGGQISWSNTTSTALSSVANGGKAHGGDKALAVTFNMKNVEFNSWVYAIIYNIQGNTVLRDVENGKAATKFGCWVYIPKGFYTAKNNGALSLQLQSLKSTSSTGTLSGNQLNLQYNGKNINALKESDIPENRWVYVTADLTANNFVKLSDPLNDIYRSPSIMRMYVKPSEAQELTYYFDDFTLDYSSAVEDRNPPIISNPTYCTNDENIALNGQTVTTNVVSFNANVAEYAASNASGLDYNSAAVYIDGVKYAAKASGSGMSLENATLSNGAHSIKFEIADKQGNPTTLTKTLVVNAAAAKSAVRLSGHNDLNNTIEAGSVYYVDIVADAIEDIDSVTATIELHSAHEWELDHMILADGFEGSYTLNSVKDNVATVTITKTGATSLTGEQIIASLPARVWSFDESTWVGGDSSAAPQHKTAAQRYAMSYGEPVLLVEAAIEKGEIEYADGTDGSFYDAFSETTAVTGNKLSPWHEHTEVALEDKAATCHEEGYSGRTYCEECGSVVDWGITLPKLEHEFAFVDDVLQCTLCGDTFTGTWTDGKEYVNGVLPINGWNGSSYFVDGVKYTGIKEVDGVYYDFGEDGVSKGPYTGLFTKNDRIFYAINGNRATGWQMIDGNWYFFDTTRYYAKTSQFTPGFNGTLEPVVYTFDSEGKLTTGVWAATANGTRYYYGPDYYKHSWEDIGEARYYFGDNGCRYEGYQAIKLSRYDHNDNYQMYLFGEDGKLIETLTSTGLLDTGNGIYYLEDGICQHKGLVRVGDDYYYFDGTYKAFVGERQINEPWNNGLLPTGIYTFGADGKLVVSSEGPKNGLFEENDGLYYYVDGVPTHAGLVEVDGYYYYIDSSCKAVTGSHSVNSYWANGLVEAGTYWFGPDGKMATAEKNGLVQEVDGLYYYVSGVPTHVGLIEVGGYYYYIDSSCKAVTGMHSVNSYWANGLLPAGVYEFGADGKMVLTVKNGLVEENDGLYYYVDGVLTHAGLIEVDGYYYYINGSCKAVTGTYNINSYWANGLMPAGTYQFADDGKMIVSVKNGLVEENDGLYYYVDGVLTHAGLIEIGGDYYYINGSCKAVTGTYNINSYWANGLVEAGTYHFGDDGKMITVKNGLVEENDGLYYYVDGVLTHAGLIEIDGDYYYINGSCKAVTGTYSINSYWANGLMPAGTYQFADDGKMIQD